MGIVIKKWKKNWKIMIMRGNNNFYLNEYNQDKGYPEYVENLPFLFHLP